jgi:methionine sulfoxide reductase heme-binding subunit
MTASSTAALWYLSRGTGVVTMVLLTIVVILGVLTRGGRTLPGLPRFAVAGLHRNASLLALGFLVVHIGSAVYDPFVTIRWVDAVIPFGGSYQPVWLGLGAVAVDLMLAVIVTSLLRHRIGRRTWKFVHWTVYAMWPIALVHSFVLGPDVRSGLELAVGVGCVLATAAAVVWRLSVPAPGDETVVGGSGARSTGTGGSAMAAAPRLGRGAAR